MFIVFEKIIFNIYYILQKLKTNFHFNIEDYIPESNIDISLNITLYELITNYKNEIKDNLKRPLLLLHFDKLFEKCNNKTNIENFIQAIKDDNERGLLKFYWNLITLELVLIKELNKPLTEIYLDGDKDIILIQPIIKEFLFLNLIRLLRYKLLDKMSSLLLSKKKDKLKKELIKDFMFLSNINSKLSYFIDLLCLIKLCNFEKTNDFLVYDKYGEIRNEDDICDIIPPEILLLFMTPKQVTQLDILFGKELILNLVSFCSTFIFYLKTECIKCSIDELCDELYKEQSNKERNYLVSYNDFCNIFNFEIYNKNKNYIKFIISSNLT